MSSKKAAPKGSKTAKKAASETKVALEKPAVKDIRTKGRGVRYDATKKQEVIDFVSDYNQKNGRGGQSAAARKFGITILTVSSWLKGSGKKVAKAPKAPKAPKAGKAPKAAKAPKEAKVSGGLTNKVKALLDLGDRIRKSEVELQKLQSQYSSLSASIRSAI
jgi:Brinker DNA-binding domain